MKNTKIVDMSTENLRRRYKFLIDALTSGGSFTLSLDSARGTNKRALLCYCGVAICAPTIELAIDKSMAYKDLKDKYEMDKDMLLNEGM